MGICVTVLRAPTDCTRNGFSAHHARLCIVNAEGPFNPVYDAPAALLVSHHPGCVCIVPAKIERGMWVAEHACTLAGGNYAESPDARFVAAVEKLLKHSFYGAVAIHDRVES